MVAKFSPKTVVGLAIALGLPFIFSLYLGSVRESLGDPERVTMVLAAEWLPAVTLLVLILLWEREGLASIGIRPMARRDLLWGILGFLIGITTFVVTAPFVSALGLETTSPGISRLAVIPLGLRVAIVITAGFTEEIIFRGYPIERLGTATGKLWIGAVLAYVLFVLLHIPFWGLGGTIQIGVWSAVVTLLYLRRRNLLACMLMHMLNDGYAFILLPALLPAQVS